MADLAAFEKATAEFIACPHCARKFAPTAYDCHVRICKMKPANPTKPTPVTKTNLSIVKPVEMAAYEQATSNFQVCPHCSRKFNPATFERHVVGCKSKTVQKPTRRLPSRAKVNAPAQTAAAVPPPPAPPAAPPTAAPAVTTPLPAQRRRDDAPVVAHASREVARQRAIDRALDPNANAPRHDTLSVLRELPARRGGGLRLGAGRRDIRVGARPVEADRRWAATRRAAAAATQAVGRGAVRRG